MCKPGRILRRISIKDRFSGGGRRDTFQLITIPDSGRMVSIVDSSVQTTVRESSVVCVDLQLIIPV